VNGYLLDTNFALLGISRPDRLSAEIRQTVENGPVYLSVLCYWEVLLKSMKGALEVGDPRQWWPRHSMFLERARAPLCGRSTPLLYMSCHLSTKTRSTAC
jgi:PIN domain nuclease of toxin-antitoxin system